MNPYWLFLIIPVSIFLGMLVIALVATGARADLETEILTQKDEIKKWVDKCDGEYKRGKLANINFLVKEMIEDHKTIEVNND